MKNIKGIIAIGLLVILLIQIVAIIYIRIQGGEVDISTNKEIMIYILGILSGYIANKD